MKEVTVIGAGNGGKACAADLALQGLNVRLFEFPQWAHNLEAVKDSKTLHVKGAIEGKAQLSMVTSDLYQAVRGADTVIVCTQAGALEGVAKELCPVLHGDQLVVLNPGSTGGALVMARVFREFQQRKLQSQESGGSASSSPSSSLSSFGSENPSEIQSSSSSSSSSSSRASAGKRPSLLCKGIVEFHTLAYGCRSNDDQVTIEVKVKRLIYGAIPTSCVDTDGPALKEYFPGLEPSSSRTVLEAGLNNGNPVIHPAITILNVAAIENRGTEWYYYKDGVSPMVARLIELIDKERMAIMEKLGYEAHPDTETSSREGYAENQHDYYECYGKGKGFSQFTSPSSLKNSRYFHEDIGYGLILYCSLGKLLGVPTPASKATAKFGGIVYGDDYFHKKKGETRTAEELGIADLSMQELKEYLETGYLPKDKEGGGFGIEESPKSHKLNQESSTKQLPLPNVS